MLNDRSKWAKRAFNDGSKLSKHRALIRITVYFSLLKFWPLSVGHVHFQPYTFTPSHMYVTELSSHSRVLPQKLTGLQLVKKFPGFYGSRRFIATFHSKRPPLVPILSHRNPVHASTSHILKTHFNITLPSMPRSSKWSLFLTSPYPKPCVHLLCLPHVPHGPATHYSQSDHLNNIWWGVRP